MRTYEEQHIATVIPAFYGTELMSSSLAKVDIVIPAIGPPNKSATETHLLQCKCNNAKAETREKIGLQNKTHTRYVIPHPLEYLWLDLLLQEEF